jgi:hypothetical protein
MVPHSLEARSQCKLRFRPKRDRRDSRRQLRRSTPYSGCREPRLGNRELAAERGTTRRVPESDGISACDAEPAVSARNANSVTQASRNPERLDVTGSDAGTRF